jgi:hypothetical protein
MRSVCVLFSFLIVHIGFSQSKLSSAISKSLPSVFLVRTFDSNNTEIALGTGFFIDSLGKGVTNHHVLEGASKATIELQDGTIYLIDRLWGVDAAHDIIGFSINNTNRRKFKYLNVKTASPQMGEEVFTIGNPNGLAFSSSNGIISSVREDFELGSIIQTTTPISNGSSGSPLLNLKSEVIGILSFSVINGQNLNFAYSSKYIKQLKDTGNNYSYPSKQKIFNKNTKSNVFLVKTPWDVPQSAVMKNEEGVLLDDELDAFSEQPELKFRSSLFGAPADVSYVFSGGLLSSLTYYPLTQSEYKSSDLSRITKSEDAWKNFQKYYGELSSELSSPDYCVRGIMFIYDEADSTCFNASKLTLSELKSFANLKFNEFEKNHNHLYRSETNYFYNFIYQVTWESDYAKYILSIILKRYFIVDPNIEGDSNIFLGIQKSDMN